MRVDTLTPTPIDANRTSIVRCANCGNMLDDRTARETVPVTAAVQRVERPLRPVRRHGLDDSLSQ